MLLILLFTLFHSDLISFHATLLLIYGYSQFFIGLLQWRSLMIKLLLILAFLLMILFQNQQGILVFSLHFKLNIHLLPMFCLHLKDSLSHQTYLIFKIISHTILLILLLLLMIPFVFKLILQFFYKLGKLGHFLLINWLLSLLLFKHFFQYLIFMPKIYLYLCLFCRSLVQHNP